MNKTLGSLAFIMACACGASAIAKSIADGDDSRPWYIALSGDAVFLQDSSLNGSVAGNLSYDNGLGGYLGFGFTPEMLRTETGDVRLELEVGYHLFQVENAELNGVSRTHRGHFRYESAMFNSYYDINTSRGLRPYVGLGIGGASASLSESAVNSLTNRVDEGFAWQAMAGVSYTPSWMTHTDVALGYRYFSMAAPEYELQGGMTKLGDVHANNAEVSLRYHF